LDQVLSRIPRPANPNVLVGFDKSDDAGVYRLSPGVALVQTVDFFTPIVDDPYTYGAIAAANALSDVYAMGGIPHTALSILAWPAAHNTPDDLNDLEQILKGGSAKIEEAGAVVVGGHSVADPEIKFGYAVTGTIHPHRIRTNAGARAGDALVLTKKIGTGVIATALKRGLASPAHIEEFIHSMLTLNRSAAEAMGRLDVHAVTDVTGFGLLGHAREMALASDVTIEIDSQRIQFLPGAVEYAQTGAIPGGLKNNREFVIECVEGSSEFEDLLYDPQTSGGLLIALPESDAGRYLKRCASAYIVGKVLERGAKPLQVK
jgi:selenide, water dikinase